MRRVGLAAVTIGGALLWLALAAAGWGGWQAFLSHPARAAAAAANLGLSVVAAFSPFSLRSGKRADFGDLWIMPVGALLVVLLGYLPAYCDRRGLLVIDGDPLRWVGVCLFVAGGVLRIWPIFVLGHRFSALVAIQEQHALVTTGPYRWIRNPSYLGGLVNGVGWALVFRSALGLLVVAAFAALMVSRIRAEERLLTSEFGAEYEAYRRRTWRLVPGIY